MVQWCFSRRAGSRGDRSGKKIACGWLLTGRSRALPCWSCNVSRSCRISEAIGDHSREAACHEDGRDRDRARPRGKRSSAIARPRDPLDHGDEPRANAGRSAPAALLDTRGECCYTPESSPHSGALPTGESENKITHRPGAPLSWRGGAKEHRREAHVPTAHQEPQADPWFSQEDAHAQRPPGHQSPPRAGPQEAVGEGREEVAPKSADLAASPMRPPSPTARFEAGPTAGRASSR